MIANSGNNGKRRILSIADATEEAKQQAQAGEPLIGAAGLKRNASKEFVIETATLIALGACERTYAAMGEQQAAAMERLHADLMEAVQQFLERRTLTGRLRRFWAWCRQMPELPVIDLDVLEGTEPKPERFTVPPVCPECGLGPQHANAPEGERIRYEYCAEHATVGP